MDKSEKLNKASREQALGMIRARLSQFDIALVSDHDPLFEQAGIISASCKRNGLNLRLLLGKRTYTLHLQLGYEQSPDLTPEETWKHELRLSYPVHVSNDVRGEWHLWRNENPSSERVLHELAPSIQAMCYVINSGFPAFRARQLQVRSERDLRAPDSPFYLGVVFEAMLQRFLR